MWGAQKASFNAFNEAKLDAICWDSKGEDTLLKAWTQDDEGALLILGLTFDAVKHRRSAPVHNIRTIHGSEVGSPTDVVLITASNRTVIAEALASEKHSSIVASHDKPVWHCVRMKNKKKVLHVCMTRDELLNLRRHPLAAFYRLEGEHVATPFDTLLLGCGNEDQMAEFLKRTRLLGPTARIDIDTTKMGY